MVKVSNRIYVVPMMLVLAAGTGACSDKGNDMPAANKPQAGNTQPAAKPAPAPKPAPQPVASTSAPDGKKIYESTCIACHAMAIAGAPKFGDAQAWAPRIAQGMDKLYSNSINGYQGEKGIMPPKGGRLDLSDDAIKTAVDYMVEAAK